MAHLPIYLDTPHPWRQRPAEYVYGGAFQHNGWFQNGLPRTVKKPKYHFIWPKDGRNGSKWGRMKDILRGTGPDIHVTISADKRDYMHNRQRRARWAKHTALDDRGPDGALKYRLPWVESGLLGGRDSRKKYDHWTRQYRKPHWWMCTDAIYQGSNDGVFPDAVRDMRGNWYQDTF
ncbi:hypothetical protein BU26DRAFT_174215 [Trematosphaeria pertusa]|uniref:Uncharacterized protein n=1 Tax=Trematosphaeria pertusa TaxID=390896 RepID=A0A6A6HW18_9PLEO|nr:uncharacterized protein BU26DRAFT_174215 [Trematosphaeria pertusa]KAF2241600.1 hypothetical protein BU26DRAFT_174215 [Trematosphaeria pertusa]